MNAASAGYFALLVLVAFLVMFGVPAAIWLFAVSL